MSISDELLAHVAGEPYVRQQKFARARLVYEGEMDAPLVDPDNGEPNDLDNVVLPICGEIVDKGVEFLFGQGVSFDVTESHGEDAQKALNRVLRLNRFDTKLVELAMNGGITGQAAIKFEPDANDPKNGRHRIVLIDPSYIDVLWNPHDVEQVLLYRIEYPTIDAESGKPFVHRQDIQAVESEPDMFGNKRIIRWTITNYRCEAPLENTRQKWYAMGVLSRQGSKWEQVGGVYDWPFEWAPIFTCQNLIAPNSYWGYSDIEGAIIRLNDVVNRVASNTAKTIRHFGHPTTIVAGGSLPEDTAIGEPIEFDESDVEVFNLEMKGDLKASLEYLKWCISMLFEAASVPEVSKGKVEGTGQISGVAIRLMFGPLMSITGKKRKTYGDMIERLLECMLQYMGYTPINGSDGAVNLVWGDPLPVNEKEQAETASIDYEIGFSKASLIERRGGDPVVESERRIDEGADDPSMRGMLDLIDNGRVNNDAVQDSGIV